MSRSFVNACTVVLCLLGAALSGSDFINRIVGKGNFLRGLSLVCGTNHSLCEDAEASKWAALTVAPGLAPIPATVAGLGYFIFLFLWFLLCGTPNRAGRWWHLIPLWTVMFGLAFSLYFLSILLWQGFACVRCFLIHGINFLVVCGVVSQWPRVLGYQAASDRGVWQDITDPTARPTPRVAVAVGLLTVASVVLLFVEIERRRLSANFASVSKAYMEQLEKPSVLEALYWDQEFKDIPIRTDDPFLGRPDAAHTVVVFSDATCGACRRFHKFAKNELIQATDGIVRVVFKHRPILGDSDDYDTLAWLSARVLEAGRQIGGAELFFNVQDKLAQGAQVLKAPSVEDLLQVTGLSGTDVRHWVDSPQCIERITSDLVLSRTLTSGGWVPLIFLDGRLVEQWDNLDLWRRILKLS